MVTLTSLNNMFSYMNYFQKSNSLYDVISTDFNSREFQKLAQKIEQQSLPKGSSFRGDFYNLKSSAQDILVSNKNSSINSKNVESTSLAVVGKAANNAGYSTHTFKIHELAQTQKNKGISLTSKASGFAEGSYTISVASAGKETDVSFNINGGDTNRQSLDKIAKAVNDARIGVTAKVVDDDKTKTSRLEIFSNEIGTKSAFELSDKKGNALEITGATNIEVTAKSAKFSLNGEEKESQSNEITLDNGKLKVTLKEVSEKEVRISVKDDKKAIYDSIERFTQNINNVIDNMSNYNLGSSVSRFANDVKSVASSERNTLSKAGINVQSDGSIKIDEARLKKAIEEESTKVKKAVEELDEIATKAVKVSEKALKGVYDLGSLESTSKDFASYLRDGNKTLYSQNFSRGMFVDLML